MAAKPRNVAGKRRREKAQLSGRMALGGDQRLSGEIPDAKRSLPSRRDVTVVGSG